MPSDPVADLVARARLGEDGALSELFAHYQPRLVGMVALRLDSSLRQRLDPADVVQEAWLEIVQRFPQWQAGSAVPFHVWLRLTTSQTLVAVQRRHLGADARDAQREVFAAGSRTNVSAANVADAFVASATTPTQAACREEVRVRVLAALEELDELDREIVLLRHFEGLTNAEAAAELAIDTSAASKRFLRALVRLQPALEMLASESTAAGRRGGSGRIG